MNLSQRLSIAGWCGILGGGLYFLHSAFGELLFAGTPGTPGFALSAGFAAANFVLLLVGFVGIAWGNGLGGRLGRIIFGVAALGYALMVVGALLMVAGVGPITDPERAVSLVYLLGRLIAVVFTVFTGIAVLVARRWRGWTRFAPLLLGLWPLIGEAGYVAVTGNTPNAIVNATWGVFNALLGLATLAQLRSARASQLEGAAVDDQGSGRSAATS